MKIVGLITEYNPFHNGHLYHIRESLRISQWTSLPYPTGKTYNRCRRCHRCYERRLCSAWYSRHYAETSPY